MKMLTVALTGLIALLGPIPGLQRAVDAQGTVTRIAHDQWTPIGWDVVPSIYAWVDGSYTFTASGLGPRWSPDGSRLAFTGNPADPYGLNEIVVANLADGSLTNLTNDPGYDGSPAWSPDGGKIAFVTDRDALITPGGSVELYVMNIDGSNPTRLTHNVGFIRPFAWSRDGGRIAFASDRDGAPELYVIAADGSNLTRLTYGAGFRGEFDWSRGGEKIAFTCEIESGNLDICTIEADGSNLVRLTSEPTDDSGAEFSPVDGRIVFTTAGQIAVLDGDGTITLIRAAGSQPRWSADGGRLAFVGTTVTWMGTCYFDEGAHNADDFCMPVDDIYVVNVDGTGLARIGSGGSIEWFVPPAARPLASLTYSCTGSTCEFDGSGSMDSDGTIAGYAWQFGDGTSGSGATAGHTYAAGAAYMVTLTITDDTGATGVLSRHVSANAAPNAAFAIVCAENTCTFDGTASWDPDGRIVSYLWSFGDGSAGYGALATHTYAAAGTYTVWLRVGDNAGAV
ncbi:MAG: PKD domain-containing protein, partial [Acidobacteria bacterium]|nr:PKD domain-containing protein [Acidobacteriota bacterium]